MKLKPHHILEAIIVILILSILVYTIVPKAIKSQHRAQIAQLKDTMQLIKSILNGNPNDSSFLHDHAQTIGGNAAGPIGNEIDNEITLFYFYDEFVVFNMKQLTEQFPAIHFDWELSELQLNGYAVYTKKNPQHTSRDGYSKRPAYAAVLARVGENLDLYYRNEPHSTNISDNGNLRFDTYITPYDPSNGLKSYGEFLVDTNDIWDATTAVLLNDLEDHFNPNWFPGINMDTIKIIRNGDL